MWNPRTTHTRAHAHTQTHIWFYMLYIVILSDLQKIIIIKKDENLSIIGMK